MKSEKRMRKHTRTSPLLTSPAGEEPRHSVKSLSTSHSPSRKCPPLQGRVGVGSLAMLYHPGRCRKGAIRAFREELSLTRGLLPALKAVGYRENQRVLTPRQVNVIAEYIGEP